MMRLLAVLFLLPVIVKAELIQVPENCIQIAAVPCLVRSAKQEALQSKNKDYSYLVDSHSITKWISFGVVTKLDLLDGTLYVKKAEDSQTTFNVNDIQVKANSFFVARDKQKLKILDGEKFLMTEYQLSSNKEIGSVVVKIDFVDKKNLISFLSNFFHTKEQLVQYLKKSEGNWIKEFASQNANQTKVLVRSIASVEDQERNRLLKKQYDEKELKKVRETFFYRTFYR
ncbi:MAG: hypothetical protein H7328_08185 [Bdellovibrio sp.]|nr:hypothetical protein [Bdellovibrio sp.]